MLLGLLGPQAEVAPHGVRPPEPRRVERRVAPFCKYMFANYLMTLCSHRTLFRGRVGDGGDGREGDEDGEDPAEAGHGGG